MYPIKRRKHAPDTENHTRWWLNGTSLWTDDLSPRVLGSTAPLCMFRLELFIPVIPYLCVRGTITFEDLQQHQHGQHSICLCSISPKWASERFLFSAVSGRR